MSLSLAFKITEKQPAYGKFMLINNIDIEILRMTIKCNISLIYDGKLTDLMPLTLETFTTHPKAKIYILHINNIALVLKIREMKFNARENLASRFLAYVKYIKSGCQ